MVVRGAGLAAATLLGLTVLGAPVHAAETPPDPVVLTVTAPDATMSYGGALPTVVPSYKGFVAGDDASDLDVAPTCVADPAAGATTCSGGADDRYTFAYVAGELTTTPVPLVITASDEERVDDDPVPTPTPSYDGLVNGDKAPARPPVCRADARTWTTSCWGAADPHYVISYVKGRYDVILLGPPPSAPPYPTAPAGSPPAPSDGDARPGRGNQARSLPAAQLAPRVLPNTGAGANALVAALGLLLVAGGAVLVRRDARRRA